MRSFYNSPMPPLPSPLMSPVSFDDVAAAHERIRAQAKRTPVLSSGTVDALTGAKVFFKCENFQRMGAFKFRGAYDALAGKILNVKTLIVMPANAPQVKLDATRGYGAEVVLYQKDEKREEVTSRLAKEKNLSLIPPFDHPQVIAGQGTAAKELIEDAGPLDYLLVPCGGAGLLSGCAIAARHMLRGCKVLGVEPAAGDDATQSFKTKTLKVIAVPDTIADGARTTSLGKLTFPLVLEYVDDMLTVTDEELLRAMFFLWERMKIIVEPTGALAACALLEKKLDARALAGRRVGVILSGGNVDLRWAAARLQARP